MADDKVSLQVEIDANGMVRSGGKVVRSLDDIKRAAGETGAALSQHEKVLKGVNDRLFGLGRQVGLVIGGIAALTGTIMLSIRSAMEAETALARLSQAIANKGNVAGVTTARLAELAGELQRTTRFSDEAVMGAQEVLLRFNSIDGTNIERVTRLTLDFAEATGTDLVSAARLLGLALDEPGEGMRALTQAGIVLEKSQKELLKSFDETGQEARGQALLLDMLEGKLRGTAETAGGTTKGSFDQLRNTVDELAESFGGPFLEGLREGAQALSDIGSSDAAVSTAQALGQSLGSIASSLATILQLLDDIGLSKGAEFISKYNALNFVGQLAGNISQNVDTLTSTRGYSSQGPSAIQEAEAQLRTAKAAKETADQAEANHRFTARTVELQQTFSKHLDNIVKGYKDMNREAKKTVDLAAQMPDYLDETQAAPITADYKRILDLQSELGIETRNWQLDLDYVRQNWQRIGLNELQAARLMKEIEARMNTVEIKSKEIQDNTADWSSAIHGIADVIGGINGDLGQMAHGIASVADGWKQMNKEGATAQDQMQGAATMAGGIQAFQAAGREMGWWGPKGGQGTFGPKDSNYAAQGQQIGTIVGAIIGSFIPAVGTVVGAAIGGLLGDIIGSAIKHGAPEGKGKITLGGSGSLDFSTTKNEKGMGEIAAGVGEQIIQNVEQFMAALGATLESIPDVHFKVRGDTISMVVGAVRGKFKSVDDAITFALVEIAQQAEISGGISQNVMNALQNSLGSSPDELMENIALAMKFDRADWDPVQVAMADYMAEFRANMTKAAQLGLDPAGAGKLLGGNLTDLRNSILGIQEDPAAAIKRKSALFNAEMQMIRAKTTMDLIKLQHDKSVLQADVGLARAEFALGQAHIENRATMIEAEGKLLNAERGLVGGMIQSLAAIDAAILASEALLASLPDLISDSEIAQAIGRSRGGGRGRGAGVDWHARMLAAVEGIREAQKRLVFGELSPFTGRQKVSAAQGEVDRLTALYNQGGRRNQTLAMEGMPQAIETYLSLFRSTYGASGAYESVAMQMNELYSRMLRDHGVAPVSVMRQQADENANALGRIFQRDPRGRLQTRNEDTDKKLDEIARDNRAANQRVAGLLEEIRDNGSANSNGGGFAGPRAPKPPRLAGQTG